MIALFGAEFAAKVAKLNLFMVGSGAIGCEYFKMLSLMGFCLKGNGKLTCTDDDHIELSNLSRQFLFRNKDIGKPKSLTAANAAREMNPEFMVNALEYRVDPSRDNVFHDEFWESLDFVLNAVDNLNARRFIDEKAAFYRKPTFESGTDGTKGTTNIFIPFKTNCYRDISGMGTGEQNTDKECTIKSFPYKLSHTVKWAKETLLDSLITEFPKRLE